MAGIDAQIAQRMALGPQALQQRYAQTQQLVDLLALQKLSKDKADAAKAIQAQMQTNPASVKDQLEQQLIAAEKQEVGRDIASMIPGVQQQGRQMAMAQQRPPMPQGQGGLPQLASPNMARMAGGGIVAFQEGGDVAAANEYIRLTEKLKDPNITPEAAQAITMMLEDMKRQAQDESRFMLEIERARGFDPAAEYERSMQEQGGMYGGGEVQRYQIGGRTGAVGRRVPIDEEELPVIPIGNGEPSTESDIQRRKTASELWDDFLYLFSAEGTKESRRRTGEVLGREEYAGTGVSSVVDPTAPTTAPTTATTPAEEMSDAELEEILKMMEDPGSTSEPEVKTSEPEAKKKREIDWDLLREMGAGMAGQTSIGGALGAGASAVGEELRRRETMASEEAQQAADRQLKMLLAEYDLDIAERKMLNDLSKVYTEAQLKIAADTLAGLDLNPDYMEAVDELADIYKGNPDAYRAAVQELKDRLVSEAVSATLRGAGVMGGSAPTTGSQSFNSFDTIGS